MTKVKKIQNNKSINIASKKDHSEIDVSKKNNFEEDNASTEDRTDKKNADYWLIFLFKGMSKRKRRR